MFCAQNFRGKSLCIIRYAGVRVYLVFDSLKDLKRIGTDASLFFSFWWLGFFLEPGGDRPGHDGGLFPALDATNLQFYPS